MRRRGWTSRWPRRLLASGVGGMVLLAGTLTANAPRLRIAVPPDPDWR